MDHLISWPGRSRPPVCYYKQPRSCDRGRRLLEKLIEAVPCVHCCQTVGWLFGQADWYSTLLCPLQPQNGHYKQWPCQSQQTWPICSEPDRSFEVWGFPLSCRGCMGKGLVVHPHTWLNMSPAWWAPSIQGRFSTLIRLETFSLITSEWNINHKEMSSGYCYSGVVWYIFTDAKSTLNTPLSASSFHPCLDLTTLFIANVALAAVYNNCPSRSITESGSAPLNGWCLQYNRARKRPPAATRAHGPSHRNNCQLAFALSGAVWLSHRAIIMIQPWVRLGLKGEIKWSGVITFGSAFPYYSIA